MLGENGLKHGTKDIDSGTKDITRFALDLEHRRKDLDLLKRLVNPKFKPSNRIKNYPTFNQVNTITNLQVQLLSDLHSSPY